MLASSAQAHPRYWDFIQMKVLRKAVCSHVLTYPHSTISYSSPCCGCYCLAENSN